MMIRSLAILLGFAPWCAAAFGQSFLTQREPVGRDEKLLNYEFEKPESHYQDLVTLKDGTLRTGKMMEWADQILLFDDGGHVTAFDGSNVSDAQFCREIRHRIRPALPDLTVACVERLPRDPSWHGHVSKAEGLPKLDVDVDKTLWRPTAGSPVTFRIHVLNAGAAKSADAPCRVLIDDAEVKAERLGALEAGASQVIDIPWKWQDGSHRLRVELDSGGGEAEIVRWNNTFEEPIQGLAVAVVVGRDLYDAFRTTPNVVDTFCFEDWAQYQIRVMNGLFRASVYPSAPQGIKERLRLDRVLVVDDVQDPAAKREWEKKLRRGNDLNGLAEYQAVLAFGASADDEQAAFRALKVDWGQLQALGRSLGLTDLTVTDTRPDQCMVLNQFERYEERHHLFPWPRNLMYSAGRYRLSEVDAGYLNQNIGQPRGLSGDYLYQLPEHLVAEVRSNSGMPLDGVQVDVFQLHAEGEQAGLISGYGHDPLYSGQTGTDGRFELLNQDAPAFTSPHKYTLRANPFGKISTDGANGLLLLRLRVREREEFHFLRLFDCAVEYLRGSHQLCVVPIRTRFAAPDAPGSPIVPIAVMEDRTPAVPPLTIKWAASPSTPGFRIGEFRIYRKTSFGGEDAQPWQLASIVRRQNRRWKLESSAAYFGEQDADDLYSPDTFFTVTTVDKEGRESALSTPLFLPSGKTCQKFAMDTEAGYMTLAGPGLARMLRWDAYAGTQPFGVRTQKFKDYEPAFEGVAVSSDHRILVTDPVNHVIAVYDSVGNLEDVFPKRPWWPGHPSNDPGEFYQPSDIAVDSAGLWYVADRGNNRVQILDSGGRFTGLLDETFAFEGPHAVAFANGHLCVTDRSGSRVRVYRREESGMKFIRELPPLIDADRCIVSKIDILYLTARDTKSGAIGLLVYSPAGETAKFEYAQFQAEMGTTERVFEPRSLCLYPGLNNEYVYFPNMFPFDLRRYKMD